jgi:hypothetical protein
MTEAEWLTSNDPEAMLEFLGEKASERKLRLFAVACVRRLWHLLGRDVRWVVSQAEADADGTAPCPDVAVVGWTGLEDPQQPAEKAARYIDASDASFAARAASLDAVEAVVEASTGGREWAVPVAAQHLVDGLRKREWACQADLLRCIFDNSFWPITLDPAWRAWHDGLLASMARQMYDSRDFRDMPILADALEEAGCDDPDILGHCRQPGPHVRGCWVVDAVLGRE